MFIYFGFEILKSWCTFCNDAMWMFTVSNSLFAFILNTTAQPNYVLAERIAKTWVLRESHSQFWGVYGWMWIWKWYVVVFRYPLQVLVRCSDNCCLRLCYCYDVSCVWDAIRLVLRLSWYHKIQVARLPATGRFVSRWLWRRGRGFLLILNWSWVQRIIIKIIRWFTQFLS